VARIRAEGLTLHALGGGTRRLPLRVLTYDEPLPPSIELAFISVKSAHTAEAAAQAARALAPHGCAITMQNGLGNRERLAAAVGERRALLGVTSHGATLLGPGEVRHAGQGPTAIAARPDHAWAERIAALLTRAGIASEMADEIEPLLWNKLLVNVGINALTAILEVPNGALVAHDASRALLRAAVEEAAAVARAKGIAIAPEPVVRAEAVARATASNISSMLADVRRGVPTEVHVINGAIVREGQALGIPTPVNEVLTRLVETKEQLQEPALSSR
jgi:2-dehydropantoate 2-reductase